MEHEEKKESKSKHEEDPFASFMFGKRKVKDDIGEKDERSKSRDSYDWLFGKPIKNKSQDKEKNTIDDFLSQIDTEKLMENVDLFLETTQELKPLWKKVSPYLQKFKK
ncbi:hypothetical protein [Niallia sp. Krafla_26]|uniref:hypothetical protein n=1 Tax=Niallia sp. Krafla_26 TaxID=3064703 RepID=UPI003D16B2A7